jgi:ParB family chromosome partitioning protein
MKTKKRALGRGLDAILQSPESDIRSKEIAQNYVVGAIANIDINTIEANPFQPRNNFGENGIQELADSIREQGIVQPITVRKTGVNKFQLISGERRIRAARLAGIKEIPSYIRVANDEQMLEMALIENIHRKDLNPLEIAASYQRLVEECKLTHETLSDRVGKKRATITNYLRLLKLPAEIQIALRDEKISMGHARALINIFNADTQLRILRKIIQKGLSVRQVESLARSKKPDNDGATEGTREPMQLAILPKQKQISNRLQTEVTIKINNKGRGNIVIPFESTDELDRLIEAIDN